METISIALVRSSDGTINRAATLTNCQTAIRKYMSEAEESSSDVVDAVKKVFDGLKGERAHMPYITYAVFKELNAQPDNFKGLSDRVVQYIRKNSSTKREDGKLFCVTKGPRGGVFRWQDAPKEQDTPKSATKTTESAQASAVQ